MRRPLGNEEANRSLSPSVGKSMSTCVYAATPEGVQPTTVPADAHSAHSRAHVPSESKPSAHRPKFCTVGAVCKAQSQQTHGTQTAADCSYRKQELPALVMPPFKTTLALADRNRSASIRPPLTAHACDTPTQARTQVPRTLISCQAPASFSLIQGVQRVRACCLMARHIRTHYRTWPGMTTVQHTHTAGRAD